MSNSRLQFNHGSTSPKLVAESVRANGLTIATQAQLPQARRLAAERIGGEVASLEALRRIQALTRSAILVFVQSGEVTGALGVVQLTDAGHEALLAGDLDLDDALSGHVARPGAPAAALYAMGIASANAEAARAVVSGVAQLREAFAHLPYYARAVTDAGRRVLIERMNCAPVPGGELLWSPARDPVGAAA